MTTIELQLIEKIVRAKVKLEGLTRKHSDLCPVNDPHMGGACRCGADDHNSRIRSALAELSLNTE